VKPRILILQNSLGPSGGAAGVAAWAIEALSEDYAVDVLTWKPFELSSVNRYYGTRLETSSFRLLAGPAWIKRTIERLDPDPRTQQPTALLMRAARILGRGSRYAASLSFCNESDFGRRIIQYIHYPYMIGRFDEEDRWWPLWGGDARHRSTRLRPWRVISGFNPRRMRANLTLVNSDWTGMLVKQAYGIDTVTLYPPVATTDGAGWDDRENVFVSIGRLSSEKRWEVMLESLRAVRARGHDIRWRVIATPTRDAEDQVYAEGIRRAIAAESAWAEMREEVSRDELQRTLARSRYGLHAMIDEHFGMAVSELAASGCLVFVPDSGGQTEIVGHERRLMYASPEEAVDKIVAVLDDDRLRTDLRASLAAHATRFSAAHFKHQLRAIVARHVSERS
jgi:glycosyltransferase involved in cell wall biosynthesis